eukprot:1407707-Amphidinium_carterae.1
MQHWSSLPADIVSNIAPIDGAPMMRRESGCINGTMLPHVLYNPNEEDLHHPGQPSGLLASCCISVAWWRCDIPVQEWTHDLK